MSDIIKMENIQELIFEIRGVKVILDCDVAELYGVETKRINEAVKNNPDKFPDGYIIELTKNEWDSLKSKFSTSTKGGKVKLPSAFTDIILLDKITRHRVALFDRDRNFRGAFEHNILHRAIDFNEQRKA